MRYQRLQQVVRYIEQNRTVTLDEICSRFNISKSTIRRDLAMILQDSDIKKVYGGVEFQPQEKLISFEKRIISNLQNKQGIAQLAASLVEDYDVIFVDSGTTVLHMVEELSEKKNLTVLTNNLEFIIRALPYKNITVFSLSGTLDKRTFSFTNTDEAEWLQRYNIRKAFMATTGLSIMRGVTNSSPAELRMKQLAVSQCQQVILLADSSKFEVASLMTYCSLDQVDILVTDKRPPSDLSRALKLSGVKTMVKSIMVKKNRAKK